MNYTRRALLEKCVSMGVVTLATSASLSAIVNAWDSAEAKRQPTPFCELGPFYKRDAPQVANLRAQGDAGMPLSLAGIVYSTTGEILIDANLQVWQTDNSGHYDNNGYRFRATLQPDAKGSYGIDSVLPGHYPGRVCQHVHYLVTAPGHKPLITQLYFASDPIFEGDPEKNYTRDPVITSRELVRPVILKGDPQQVVAVVTFDLVLEKN